MVWRGCTTDGSAPLPYPVTRRLGREIGKSDKFEIARFLHLKAEIQNLRSKNAQVQFEFSDFGFEMQESCDFEIVRFPNSPLHFGIPCNPCYTHLGLQPEVVSDASCAQFCRLTRRLRNKVSSILKPTFQYDRISVRRFLRFSSANVLSAPYRD
jgi:hypothetical protein